MHFFLPYASQTVLICLFMVILPVHTLAVTPPREGPMERLHILPEANDALSESRLEVITPPPAPPLPDLVPPTIPTETLQSHGSWHDVESADSEARGGSPGQGHATVPGTETQQWKFDGRTRTHDSKSDWDGAPEGHPVETVLHPSYHHGLASNLNPAPWVVAEKHVEPSPTRHRPGGMRARNATGRYGYRHADLGSSNAHSGLSVFAISAVGLILTCHYLDYL